ncbi:MAG: hypothetical protein KatS3mg104_3176 [Phycisphaerae bacterium]|nr:MAG: hypothetical protein KatS3mg104_3176 [Phycisphaerae bacterium]
MESVLDRMDRKTSTYSGNPRATDQDTVRRNVGKGEETLSGRRGSRGPKGWLGVLLLILACIVGGTARGELSPDRGQGVLIIAVVLFVAAMLTLAFAMIEGNSTRSKTKN